MIEFGRMFSTVIVQIKHEISFVKMLLATAKYSLSVEHVLW